MEETIQRTYFTMDYVAKRVGESQPTIRLWIDEFGVVIHKRKGSQTRGYRLFTENDIQQLEHIRYLLKVRMFTHAGAKKELKDSRTIEEIRAMLRVG